MRKRVNERKNSKDHRISIKTVQSKTEQVNEIESIDSKIKHQVILNLFLDTVGTNIPPESDIKRDVHNFIFDDETVVVDDCSFVLPYIEGAYYYQSTTPPPATDIPLSTIDVNTDEYSIPLVPSYTEQQLKELLRRQV